MKVNQNNRTSAREFSFQFLFHLQLPIFDEIKSKLINGSDDTELQQTYQELRDSIPNKLSGEPENYAITLIKKTLSDYDNINQMIERHLINWKLERISKVDYAILLVAMAEVIHFNQQTPPKVVINEAVELTKKFSTPDSASFVNGMLDRALKEYL
jgi:N utilization substance protein B